MKIDEAAALLEQGKKVNSANAQATLEPYTAEGEKRVKVTRKRRDGQEEVMDFSLQRLRGLYQLHDFGLGSYSVPAENKAAKAPETK